jgi:hypothetical protein
MTQLDVVLAGTGSNCSSIMQVSSFNTTGPGSRKHENNNRSDLLFYVRQRKTKWAWQHVIKLYLITAPFQNGVVLVNILNCLRCTQLPFVVK